MVVCESRFLGWAYTTPEQGEGPVLKKNLVWFVLYFRADESAPNIEFKHMGYKLINKWDTKEKYSKLLVFTYRRSRQNVWKYDKRHITYWNSQLIYKLANTCRHNDVTAGICRKQSFTYKGMRQVLNISTWAYSETHTNNISIKKAVFHL